ncbi:MAG: 3D domain-containing protein [Gaiellales bacterium]
MRRPAVRLARIPLLALAALAIGAGSAWAHAPGDTLRVKATAYGGHQPTATGVKTRHGICAVDPNVIPLGTRFRVPGYGVCLAADTGGEVKGAYIDVWFTTERIANRWGVRTVTIRFL